MNKNISLKESIAILIVLLVFLGVLIIGFQLSPHIPILTALMCLLFYGRFKKFTWDKIHDGTIKGIIPGIILILILLLTGVLVASWILFGTIPTIMVYRFKLVSVRFFLPTIFLVYAIVGVTVSSPFIMVSTIGIVFLGIGHLLGFNDAMTIDAVISGTFLGNNCSPLSDTTNLATGIGGVNLLEYIVGMRYMGFPVSVFSLISYTISGHNSHSADLASINEMIQNMKASSWISPWTLIPLVILSKRAIRKIPAIPTSLAGLTAALILSFIYEKSLTVGKATNILMNDYVANIPDPKLDELLP